MNSGKAKQVRRRPRGRSVGDELDGVLGQAAGVELVGQDAVEGPVGVDRLLAAAEDRRRCRS